MESIEGKENPVRVVLRMRWDWRRELRVCPEAYVFPVVLLVAIVLQGRLPGALPWFQVWGSTTAIGALWVLAFPRYMQRASASDLAVKSMFVLVVGFGVISAHWMYTTFHEIALTMVAGHRQHMPMPLWVWLFGGAVGVAGLAGLLLCKRLSRSISKTSPVVLRVSAIVVLAAATLLVAKATMVGLELRSIGTNCG